MTDDRRDTPTERLVRIEEQTKGIIQRFDDFMATVKRTLDDHETRIRELRDNEVRIMAYVAAVGALILVGWPFVRSILHLGGP